MGDDEKNLPAHVQSHVAAVDKLQQAMRQMPQLQMAEEHLFVPGVYGRVLHMPAGSVIVSKIHKTEHFLIALTGRATVVYDDRREEVIAPRIMITKPGTQRALYIHEDSTWVGFYPIPKDEQGDVAKIEQRIIAKDFNDPELLAYFAEQQKLLTHED